MSLQIPRIGQCAFCAYLSGTTPCVFVHRGDVVSSLLNRTQYERGALLVISNTHTESVLSAGVDLINATYLEARRLARLLVDRMGATGVNIFQNNGIPAGQTVPHYHVHVVPRYATSDPARRFRESDFDVTPLQELAAVAQELRG
jgi:histidine triad (HIT) family protein